MHGDVAPRNMMLRSTDSGEKYRILKIGDFGSSRQFEEAQKFVNDNTGRTQGYYPAEASFMFFTTKFLLFEGS